MQHRERTQFLEWMRERNILQKDLAEVLGLSLGAVNQKLQGNTGFTEKDFIKLFNHYGLSADFVMGITAKPFVF